MFSSVISLPGKILSGVTATARNVRDVITGKKVSKIEDGWLKQKEIKELSYVHFVNGNEYECVFEAQFKAADLP